MTKKRKDKGTHARAQNELEERIRALDHYPRIDTNVEYGEGLGECDIRTSNSKRVVYWEVKSMHSDVGYSKAQAQLLRWCKYMEERYGGMKDYYGIYHSPEYDKGFKIMAKNGVKR